ncbi:hypothetical protein P618_200139 [Holospora obtusa F1]|uniref:Uncharacterized protein n=1 Tax=Holospora obtusa F1 TaxID=1399147 RepID=W6TI39_HOLOB|nr:hypothetical protein [Holospora obtusa]ETZ07670.1 hypothetical protein P618_200139 [Holospora obtusa F1]
MKIINKNKIILICLLLCSYNVLGVHGETDPNLSSDKNTEQGIETPNIEGENLPDEEKEDTKNSQEEESAQNIGNNLSLKGENSTESSPGYRAYLKNKVKEFAHTGQKASNQITQKLFDLFSKKDAQTKSEAHQSDHATQENENITPSASIQDTSSSKDASKIMDKVKNLPQNFYNQLSQVKSFVSKVGPQKIPSYQDIKEMSTKIKNFSGKFFKDFPDLRNWVPEGTKNIYKNVSYRYLRGGNKVASSVIDLFKMYVAVAQRTVNDLDTFMSTGANIVKAGATGGALGVIGAVASNAASYVSRVSNPANSIKSLTGSLGSLDTLAKTFLYAFQMSQNTFVNIISDIGRGLFTKQTVFKDFLKEPDAYKAIVDGYVFEKCFKALMNTMIGVYLIYYINGQYYLDNTQYQATFAPLEQAIKTFAQSLPKIFEGVNQKKGWIEKSKALYETLFNSNDLMKQFEKSIISMQTALLDAFKSLLALGEKRFSEKGYQSLSVCSSWMQACLSIFSAATQVQSKKLSTEIFVNETLRDGPKTLTKILAEGFNWGKSLFSKKSK